MKFSKSFESYQSWLHESGDLPSRFAQVNYGGLKKILKRCLSFRAHLLVSSDSDMSSDDGSPAVAVHDEENVEDGENVTVQQLPCQAEEVGGGCPRCDDTFFGSLEDELRSIERSFSREATWLVTCHNARGLLSIYTRFSVYHRPDAMYCAASSLVEHLALSYLATQKIVKKYTKVHRTSSNSTGAAAAAGGVNQQRVERIRLLQQNILRSPLLVELTAMLANLSIVLQQQGYGDGRCPSKEQSRAHGHMRWLHFLAPRPRPMICLMPRTASVDAKTALGVKPLQDGKASPDSNPSLDAEVSHACLQGESACGGNDCGSDACGKQARAGRVSEACEVEPVPAAVAAASAAAGSPCCEAGKCGGSVGSPTGEDQDRPCGPMCVRGSG